MKRNLFAFLVIGLAGVGCDPLVSGFLIEKPDTLERPVDSAPVTRKEKPITADQISEQNARDKANTLMLELDRDEQGGLRIETEMQVPASKK
jgi:hypothetical protein